MENFFCLLKYKCDFHHDVYPFASLFPNPFSYTRQRASAMKYKYIFLTVTVSIWFRPYSYTLIDVVYSMQMFSNLPSHV